MVITVVYTQCMHIDIISLSVAKPIVTKYKSDFFALVWNTVYIQYIYKAVLPTDDVYHYKQE